MVHLLFWCCGSANKYLKSKNHTFLKAPVIKQSAYDSKGDIWNLIITIIELAEGVLLNSKLEGFVLILSIYMEWTSLQNEVSEVESENADSKELKQNSDLVDPWKCTVKEDTKFSLDEILFLNLKNSGRFRIWIITELNNPKTKSELQPLKNWKDKETNKKLEQDRKHDVIYCRKSIQYNCSSAKSGRKSGNDATEKLEGAF